MVVRAIGLTLKIHTLLMHELVPKSGLHEMVSVYLEGHVVKRKLSARNKRYLC